MGLRIRVKSEGQVVAYVRTYVRKFTSLVLCPFDLKIGASASALVQFTCYSLKCNRPPYDELQWLGKCACVCTVERCGVEWSGVEWNGVEWSGVGWSGVE